MNLAMSVSNILRTHIPKSPLIIKKRRITMAKLRKSDIAIITYEIVAGIGIDTILTGIAKATVPAAIGIPGIFQKVCIKAATLGLSFAAVEGIERCAKTCAKEVLDVIEQEVKTQNAH
jgi:hypothetical protein